MLSRRMFSSQAKGSRRCSCDVLRFLFLSILFWSTDVMTNASTEEIIIASQNNTPEYQSQQQRHNYIVNVTAKNRRTNAVGRSAYLRFPASDPTTRLEKDPPGRSQELRGEPQSFCRAFFWGGVDRTCFGFSCRKARRFTRKARKARERWKGACLFSLRLLTTVIIFCRPASTE